MAGCGDMLLQKVSSLHRLVVGTRVTNKAPRVKKRESERSHIDQKLDVRPGVSIRLALLAPAQTWAPGLKDDTPTVH